jgi:hypothetical protein
MKSLRKMKVEILHPPITGVTLDKEGPLQYKTQDSIEQIGLEISDKLNGNIVNSKVKNNMIKRNLNFLKWVLIGGGPIFFFIRALGLASTGGDCFGRINPGFSWFLLLLEIIISGITGVSAIISLILLKLSRERIVISRHFSLKKIILITGVSAYSIHFIRVGIWIVLCVI